MHRVFVGFLSILFAQTAFSGAPLKSFRPVPRGAINLVEPEPVGVPVFYNATIRPTPRPVSIVHAAAPLLPQTSDHPRFAIMVASKDGVVRSPRPVRRPANLGQNVLPRRQSAQITTTCPAGSVCGDSAIRGQTVAPIKGRIAQCGIAHPVRVTAISGVNLSQAALMNCKTARALKKWIVSGAKPAVGRRGGGIKSLKILAHYTCRTRNNQAGAKISEHGKGNAIDIGAINLVNGTSISVLGGWNDRRDGKLLRRMHRAACGPFGVVLGPDANKYHKNHFHFDISNLRNPYCH